MAQLVPQQRCAELQLGLHIPGMEESMPPPSEPPTQLPLTQLPPPQLTPQPPQWFGSLLKAAQTWLAPEAQQACPDVQAGEQLPDVPPSPPRPPPPEQPSARLRLKNATQRSDAIPMSSKDARIPYAPAQASGGIRTLSTQGGMRGRD